MRKRKPHSNPKKANYELRGGPYDGKTLRYSTECDGTTLTFSCKGMTGYYVIKWLSETGTYAGYWKPTVMPEPDSTELLSADQGQDTAYFLKGYN